MPKIGRATDDDRMPGSAFILFSSLSRTHGSSNAKARSIRSNGKVGTLTFGCIIIVSV
jgi:hypothetical protein